MSRTGGQRQPAFFREVTAAVHGAADQAALRREGFDSAKLIDFSANYSPLGAAPSVAAALATVAIDTYPDPRASEICARFAEYHRIDARQVVCGNGSTELIRLIAQLVLRSGDTALTLGSPFGEYDVATQLTGARLKEVPLTYRGPGAGFSYSVASLYGALSEDSPRLCWLCSPHNPTGGALAPSLVADLVIRFPKTLFVLDEAYGDLLTERQWSPALLDAGNLVVLRSLTKYWGLAGLRLGYAIGSLAIADALRAALPPWNVNACAQAAGKAALDDPNHYRRTIEVLVAEHKRLMLGLQESGWTPEPSAAGFFLVHVGDAAAARRELLLRGCLVRDCTSFGLPNHVRLSPRRPAENDLLLEAFRAVPHPKAVR